MNNMVFMFGIKIFISLKSTTSSDYFCEFRVCLWHRATKSKHFDRNLYHKTKAGTQCLIPCLNLRAYLELEKKFDISFSILTILHDLSGQLVNICLTGQYGPVDHWSKKLIERQSNELKFFINIATWNYIMYVVCILAKTNHRVLVIFPLFTQKTPLA